MSKNFRRNFTTTVLWLGIGALASGPTPAPAQEPPDLEALRAFTQLLVEQLNGHIRLGGSVLDDSGRPLGDVSLLITTARFDPSQASMRAVTRSREIVTGGFRYECEGCSHVHLWFNKQGYHSEVLEFVPVPTNEGSPVLVETQLQVELVPVRDPVVLQEYGGILSIGGALSASVLPVHTGPTGTSADLKRLRAKAERGDAQDALAYIALEAQMDADGNLVTIPVTRTGTIKTFLGPASPALDFSPARGGVIAFQPSERRIDLIYREMREAPESGYQPRLELDPARDRPQFFYCYIDGRYGKGMVHTPRIEETRNGARLVAFAEILLNPKGGRSLESPY